MRRTPLFRVLCSFLALVVAANAALAGRPHGCDASRAARVAESGGSAGHGTHGAHAAGHQTDRSVPDECSCIGHACCSSAVLVLNAGRAVMQVVTLSVAVFSTPAATTHVPLPAPHLHPFPLGPPAPLS